MTRPAVASLSAAFALSICLSPGSAWGQQMSAQIPSSDPQLLVASAGVPNEVTAPSVDAAVTYSSSAASSAVGTEAADAQAAPAQSPSTGAAPEHQDPQTKRILGIIPNFRAVSANVTLPPQSVKEKFVTASQDSFDYSSFLLPGIIAGYNQARNNTPEFHQGAVGYGRYYWHSFVDQTSENYFVEFIVPAIAHEDTRFYTLGHGGFGKRVKYSLSRVIITRDDAGKEVFNAGEILGAGMSAGLSSTYYPSRERSFGNTGGQWASTSASTPLPSSSRNSGPTSTTNSFTARRINRRKAGARNQPPLPSRKAFAGTADLLRRSSPSMSSERLKE